jgi:uncharacterized protein YndB with AHSA1/START domain
MTRTITRKLDPKLDLVLERVVGVPPNLVWAAWTRPDYVKKWFTPAPWQTVDCEIDLRPGGIFRTVIRSPEGQDFPNTGCYLEVIENEKLTWTAALTAGYPPQNAPSAPPFTAAILLWNRTAPARSTPLSPSTAMKRAPKNTWIWVSTMAGVKPWTNSSPSRRGC